MDTMSPQTLKCSLIVAALALKGSPVTHSVVESEVGGAVVEDVAMVVVAVVVVVVVVVGATSASLDVAVELSPPTKV